MKLKLTLEDLTQEQVTRVLSVLDTNNAAVADHVAPFVAPASNSAPFPEFTTGQVTHQVPDEDESQAAPITEGDVDAEGLPWDERIHSSNHKKTEKGFWVKRRGVQEFTYNDIKAELLKAKAATAYVAEPVVTGQTLYAPGVYPEPQPQVQPVYNPQPQMQPQTLYAPQPQVQPVYAAPIEQQIQNNFGHVVPQVQAAAPQPGREYNSLMEKIGALFNQQLITPEYIAGLQNQISAQFQVNVAAITDIQARPDMVEFAFQLLARDGK